MAGCSGVACKVGAELNFIFEFSEADTDTLCALLRECLGVKPYASLTAQFFSQLSEQERRQRKAAMAQLPQWTEECSQ